MDISMPEGWDSETCTCRAIASRNCRQEWNPLSKVIRQEHPQQIDSLLLECKQQYQHNPVCRSRLE